MFAQEYAYYGTSPYAYRNVNLFGVLFLEVIDPTSPLHCYRYNWGKWSNGNDFPLFCIEETVRGWVVSDPDCDYPQEWPPVATLYDAVMIIKRHERGVTIF